MNREEAIRHIRDVIAENNSIKPNIVTFEQEKEALYMAIEALSADDKWITDRKPKEDGRYMVTLDSFGHKRIDLFYYGKPLMPNRKVRGKCWYRSDDEWGDIVYDDSEILAWMPLPKPYKGGDDE